MSFSSVLKSSSVTKPAGGTELLFAGLRKHVPTALLSKVHISVSAVDSPIRHLKPHIFWAHQSYDQPSVQNLRDPLVQASIDCFVFVSEWQKGKYIEHFGIPEEKCVVIRNAILPIPVHAKPAGKIRLIYTSTPFRGLDVLLDAFTQLQNENVELYIYSGMALYGRPLEDARFAALYQQAKSMPNVTYHGVVSNDEIREALQSAHIFAYPSTWEETSCVALIEALSAGCLAVAPTLGALSETGNDFAQLYPYEPDKKAHAQSFATELKEAIERLRTPKTQTHLGAQVMYYNQNYSWQTRKKEWEALLTQLIHTHGIKI